VSKEGDYERTQPIVTKKWLHDPRNAPIIAIAIIGAILHLNTHGSKIPGIGDVHEIITCYSCGVEARLEK
jgi:hypothetical protein